MNEIQRILDQLLDTDAAVAHFERLAEGQEFDPIHASNLRAIQKRRGDLERRLSNELKATQSDLVQYHVSKPQGDRYPVMAVANAIAGFQELITAVFDAIRSAPKQRYRPSPENAALSSLDFAMALPVQSVLISMSVENERLIAVKSDLDLAFERVFEILSTRETEKLRDLAETVGIASISKAHDWAVTSSQFGLNTKIKIQKDADTSISYVISNADAQRLKEAIEEKSDRTIDPFIIVGELVGIDVDPQRSYFHVKTDEGQILQGRLSDGFPTGTKWAVHVRYTAHLSRVTTVKYATGEEKIEWLLNNLSEVREIDRTPHS